MITSTQETDQATPEASQRPADRPGKPKTYRPPQSRIAIWVPLIVVLLLAVGLVYGIWHHIQVKRSQEDFAQKTSAVSVDFVPALRNAKPRDLVLPANVTAAMETTIYARANGYVERWLVDLGDNVKEGQLLAVLATPEVDQQLAQARQQLNQAQADFELARVSAQRWRQLAEKSVVSKQDNDTRQQQYQSATGEVKAAQANVERLAETQGFKNVVAPFAGTITLRSLDVGTLVTAGGGSGGTPLYKLATTDPLDIYVNVPQTNVGSVKVGLEVDLLVPEFPDKAFKGKVIRTAGAIDPTSRTLLTEVEVPNPKNTLFAGMYAQVKFTFTDQNTPLIIPANAFVFRTEGPQVATLSNDNKIHWQSIEVGRDFGKDMEVTKGLQENQRIVLNPTDDLKEGLQVQAKAGEFEQKDVTASK